MNTNFHGLLVIDKPAGITSRTAVDRAQGWFPKGTRLGHTGTLDPLATGVLVLCVGVATRLAEYVQLMPKVYRAGIILGATSDTDDADGALTPSADAKSPSRALLEEHLASFLGKIAQIPPAYSAAKVSGRRAYALARKGKEVDLQPRTVMIERIDIINYTYPHLELVVRCGKGTYIRSLARDLGIRLGCGGYIASLRRTEVGWFTEGQSVELHATPAAARTALLPAWRAVQDGPPNIITEEEATQLLQGKRIRASWPDPRDLAVMAVLDAEGRTFAIVELIDGWMQPIKVLAGANAK